MSDSPASGKLPVVHALIWRAARPDTTFDPAEFESRIPRVMRWLAAIRAEGKLVACGGGGFEAHAGGLTLVRADSVEDAMRLAALNPLNEIGSTDLFVWDVYWAALDVPREWPQPAG